MECADRLALPVSDLDFSYFTAGLGGSGEINLLITNEGFGDAVPVYRDGQLSPQMDAGSSARKVDFYLSQRDASAALVGRRTVWSWPFPEGCTVAEELCITGDSSVGMGTAPELWNGVMGALVRAVPRSWWRSRAFSQGLADFSKPLVAMTDPFVGETHAMRIDVHAASGQRVSAVQAHESFRGVVGQCCAEFTMSLLEAKGMLTRRRSVSRVEGEISGGELSEDESSHGEVPALPSSSGVFLPESLFADRTARAPMLQRLLSVPGTVSYGFEKQEV